MTQAPYSTGHWNGPGSVTEPSRKSDYVKVPSLESAQIMIDALQGQLAAVRRLHFPYDCTEAGTEGHETCGQREWCYSCGEGQPWPCTTFQAMRDAPLEAPRKSHGKITRAL